MSEAIELQRAKHEFNKYVSDLSANQASFARLFERDRPRQPQVDVEHPTIVEVFIKKNPNLARFHGELLRSTTLPRWTLNKQRWEAEVRE